MDNTTAKRKRTKGHTMMYNTKQKTKIEQHETHLKPMANACVPKGNTMKNSNLILREKNKIMVNVNKSVKIV